MRFGRSGGGVHGFGGGDRRRICARRRHHGARAAARPPDFAPQGAKACSLGREPQEERCHNDPKPRRGDGRSIAPRTTAVAPSGLWMVVGTGSLGLTPQATCLCPLRGKMTWRSPKVRRDTTRPPAPLEIESERLRQTRRAPPWPELDHIISRVPADCQTYLFPFFSIRLYQLGLQKLRKLSSESVCSRELSVGLTQSFLNPPLRLIKLRRHFWCPLKAILQPHHRFPRRGRLCPSNGWPLDFLQEYLCNFHQTLAIREKPSQLLSSPREKPPRRQLVHLAFYPKIYPSRPLICLPCLLP